MCNLQADFAVSSSYNTTLFKQSVNNFVRRSFACFFEVRYKCFTQTLKIFYAHLYVNKACLHVTQKIFYAERFFVFLT